MIIKPVINFIIFISIWIALISLLTFGIVKKCSAQSNEDTALALAQCLVAECDRCDRGQERDAIAWILWKGMERYNANPRNLKKRTLYGQIKAYCAVFDKRSVFYYGERAKAIRRSNTEFHKHVAENKWKELIAYSRGFISARKFDKTHRTDPYPASTHFGGSIDVQRAKSKGLKLLGKYCNKRGKWCTYIWGKR